MAFLAPLAPIAIAAATGLVGTVGARVGKKLSDLFGLKERWSYRICISSESSIETSYSKKNWHTYTTSGFYGHTSETCKESKSRSQ